MRILRRISTRSRNEHRHSLRDGRRLFRDDRGDITILAAGIVLILFIAVGLVADGGGLMRARDDARMAAEQAARAASQQISESGTFANSTGVPIDAERASRIALDAATARGYDADITQVDGQLVVTTRGNYHTTFWRIFGLRNVSVQGEAQVRLAENAS